MDTIKVNKTDLLDKLRENRQTHEQTYNDALAGWKEQVKNALDEARDDAFAGRKFVTDFDLPKPQEYLDSYDRAIGMLEMSVDDTIELDEREFGQYVQDDWSWKRSFKMSSSTYTTVK